MKDTKELSDFDRIHARLRAEVDAVRQGLNKMIEHLQPRPGDLRKTASPVYDPTIDVYAAAMALSRQLGRDQGTLVKMLKEELSADAGKSAGHAAVALEHARAAVIAKIP